MSQIQITGEAKIRDLQGPVVANSGVITALDGLPSQYVRGDGTLADIPSVTGGGASVSYYLNGSVNQGTFGGSTYYELGENAITGGGTNFSTSTDGLIAQFITDPNVPDLSEIPSGNWNIEFYMGVSASSGALASFYAELYKYDGTTFTLIASSVGTPEVLTNTTTVSAYFSSIAVPQTPLAVTDRIAIRVYASVEGKTVTMYTEDNRLCQVVTTFSRGMLSLNSLTDQQQYLTVGTAGTDFNIVSALDTHTFNIPSASATNRGLITTGTQTIAGNKGFTGTANFVGGAFFPNNANFIKDSTGITPLVGYVTPYITSWANGFVLNLLDGSSTFKSSLKFDNSADYDYTFPAFTGTVALLEGSQTFSGVKSFSLAPKQDAGILLKNGTNSTLTGYTGIGGLSTNNGLQIYLNGGGLEQNLIFQTAASYTYTFPDASGTITLLEENQNVTGFKQFSSDGGTGLDYGFTVIKGLSPTFRSTSWTTVHSATGDKNLVISDSFSSFAKLQFQSTGDITYTFPASSGTIALTSNLSAYVPYTGATGPVNLGIYALSSNGLNIFGSSVFNANSVYLKAGLTAGGLTDYITVYHPISGNGVSYYDGTSLTSANLVFDTTGSRTYTYPAASGTIALTSNLSSYLPLSGGTLTGALTTPQVVLTPSGSALSTNNALSGSSIGATYLNGGTAGLVLRSSGTTNSAITLVDSGSYIEFIAGASEKMRLTSAGSILLGTTADTGERLQVAGTAKFTGALSGTSATFSGLLTLNKDNVLIAGSPSISTNSVQFNLTSSGANLSVGVDNSAGTQMLVTGGVPYASIVSTNNSTPLILGTNLTARLTIASTGAATFSSSVTAGGAITSSVASGNGSFYINNASLTNKNWTLIPNTSGGETDLLFFYTGVGASTKMTITSGGNVGIGTSSPTSGLSSTETTLQIENGNVAALSLNNTSSRKYTIYSGVGGQLGFYDVTAATERMRITSGGNVLIGTTASNGWPLEVESKAGGEQIYLKRSAANAQMFMGGVTGADTLFYIRSNGSGGVYLASGGVAWLAASDERLKTDLVKIEDAINKVCSLRSLIGRYKTDKEGTRRPFLIAQDVIKVLPEAVNENKETGDLGVSYTELIPLLVAAIKELKAEIEELKALIAAK